MKINEYSENIQHFQVDVAGGHFLPNLHREIAGLSKQLGACFHAWIYDFAATQTRLHRLFRQCIYSNAKLDEVDLSKDQQYLVDLYQIVHQLQDQHQEKLNQLIQHYLDRLTDGETYASFIPYATNNEADSVFIAYYALYYSTTQLAHSILKLGEIIHTILELETTRVYRHF